MEYRTNRAISLYQQYLTSEDPAGLLSQCETVDSPIAKIKFWDKARGETRHYKFDFYVPINLNVLDTLQDDNLAKSYLLECLFNTLSLVQAAHQEKIRLQEIISSCWGKLQDANSEVAKVRAGYKEQVKRFESLESRAAKTAAQVERSRCLSLLRRHKQAYKEGYGSLVLDAKAEALFELEKDIQKDAA